jgi:hypothetical protein
VHLSKPTPSSSALLRGDKVPGWTKVDCALDLGSYPAALESACEGCAPA